MDQSEWKKTTSTREVVSQFVSKRDKPADQSASKEASHSVGLTARKEASLTVRKSADASMQINMQIHFSTPSHPPLPTPLGAHTMQIFMREGKGHGSNFGL